MCTHEDMLATPRRPARHPSTLFWFLALGGNRLPACGQEPTEQGRSASCCTLSTAHSRCSVNEGVDSSGGSSCWGLCVLWGRGGGIHCPRAELPVGLCHMRRPHPLPLHIATHGAPAGTLFLGRLSFQQSFLGVWGGAGKQESWHISMGSRRGHGKLGRP